MKTVKYNLGIQTAARPRNEKKSAICRILKPKGFKHFGKLKTLKKKKKAVQLMEPPTDNQSSLSDTGSSAALVSLPLLDALLCVSTICSNAF